MLATVDAELLQTAIDLDTQNTKDTMNLTHLPRSRNLLHKPIPNLNPFLLFPTP